MYSIYTDNGHFVAFVVALNFAARTGRWAGDLCRWLALKPSYGRVPMLNTRPKFIWIQFTWIRRFIIQCNCRIANMIYDIPVSILDRMHFAHWRKASSTFSPVKALDSKNIKSRKEHVSSFTSAKCCTIIIDDTVFLSKPRSFQEGHLSLSF